MLTTHDIGNLFESMRVSYGAQWKHGTEAMPVWRNALARFTPDQLMKAANDVLKAHVDYPPTLPQFLFIIDPPVSQTALPGTYLPPPQMPPASCMANRLLFQLLRNFYGVDKFTLNNMVMLKNALVDELDRKPDEEFLIDLENQLTALAKNHNEADKQKQREAATKKYCLRHGLVHGGM